MAELGFAWCATEHALYTRQRGKEEPVVGVYVDDLIVTGAQEKDIEAFKVEMATRFQMSDLGALSYYLGIEVKQGSGEVTLGQRAYARKLGMANCKPTTTPMEERIKLSKQSTTEKVDAARYQSIVGGLRWLTHTRPDIAFAVGYVSRFMEDLREDHRTVVKGLLHYIQGSGTRLSSSLRAVGLAEASWSSRLLVMWTWRATSMGGAAPQACWSSSAQHQSPGSH
jgi:hypothetical protein